MDATNLILYPMPPPTSNHLDNRQRRRLVRSTRKLGDVLGATPIVAEFELSPPIPIPSSRPRASVSSSSSESTVSSEEKQSRRQASICSYSPNSASLFYSSPSCESSVVSLTLPLSPTPPNVDLIIKKKCSMRLKQCTKQRPVREPPQPLVIRLNSLPQTSAIQSPCSPEPHTPTRFAPFTPTPTSSPALTPLTPVFPSAVETRRKRMAKLTRTLGEIIPPHLVLASRRTSLGPISDTPFSPGVQELASATSMRKRRSMSINFGEENYEPYPRSSRVWVTGSETWTGEWNRKDIRDVQKQLRSLKSR
ncbi:hypothetical protein PHLCEN_2v11471 [Hermanssonia centrifuga]|uniref:Uncharacterized protein n=1 Tax=Hermanssonia centrifuga TaxID=98765 RepID=A0A2R6NJX4_9APHY|nr:hypothetical protein PHLCEN_2v11471 [Hermanssonia centrifuga]